MSAEHVEGYEPDAPRGWDALRPTPSTARLWADYSAEINRERDELLEALGALIGVADGPYSVRGTAELEYATTVYHKAAKRAGARCGE